MRGLKLRRVSLYIWSMAEPVRVVSVARVLELVAGDDRAIDVLLGLVVLLSDRRRGARRTAKRRRL